MITWPLDWYADVQAFWDETGERIRNYRRDRQAGQRERIELWCEAAGMAPQLARVADEYSVPVYSSAGFSSLSAIRQIVDRARRRDVPTVLMHVGDYDPSGESIFESMAADAGAFLEEDRLLHLQRLIPVRVALTADQVDVYELETSPPKTSDSRSRSWVGETCQLEALAPDQLAELVRGAIETRLSWTIYTSQIDYERDDITELQRMLPA